MIQPVQQVDVFYNQHKVGRLALRRRKIFFEYDKEFLASGLELSPFKLPLQPAVLASPDAVFEGSAGCTGAFFLFLERWYGIF